MLTTEVTRGVSGYSVIAVQSDGKILQGGVQILNAADSDLLLVRYNRDGTLDSSFAGDGTVSSEVSFIGRGSDWVRDMFTQADGKILLAGYSVEYGSNAIGLVLARYNQDGSPDLTFGVEGIVTTSDSAINLFGNSMAFQVDGKLVVGGSGNLYGRNVPGNGSLLVRYNSDGSLDSSFSGDGVVLDATTKGIVSVVVQTDGKILAVGSSDNGDSLSSYLVLVRYNSDGALDSSFSGDGIVTTRIGASSTASSVAVQADGKILVAGTTSTDGSNGDFALVRYNRDGSLDKTFSGDGVAIADFNSGSEIAYKLTVQLDGKILVAGQTSYADSNIYDDPGAYFTTNTDFALARFNVDGSLDTTFSFDGKVTADFGSHLDVAYDVLVQADGRIVLGGTTFHYVATDSQNGGHTDLALARYNSDGTLDRTFDGRVDTILGTNGNDVLASSPENDVIDGLGGTDRVLFSGPLSGYSVSKAGPGYSVAGVQGTDSLSNVEYLVFSDKTVNLTIQALAASTSAASLSRIEELYVAFFNRVPDADGLVFWVQQLQQGVTINRIADSFYEAGVHFSALTGFSSDMSNADFVNAIYRNVLGRSSGADAEGLAFWSNELVSGRASKGVLVSTILDSAHTFKNNATWGWVADLLDNKLMVANKFAVELGLNYNSSEESISHGMAIASAVTPEDTSVAIALIGVHQIDI